VRSPASSSESIWRAAGGTRGRAKTNQNVRRFTVKRRRTQAAGGNLKKSPEHFTFPKDCRKRCFSAEILCHLNLAKIHARTRPENRRESPSLSCFFVQKLTNRTDRQNKNEKRGAEQTKKISERF
jgi:hypothetical protein